MLTGLDGLDEMAERFPVMPYSVYIERRQRDRKLRKKLKTASGARAQEIKAQLKAHSGESVRTTRQGVVQTVLRWSQSGQGFRERLARFWADHFTVVGKSALTRSVVSTYLDEAIRPHLAGSFGDMLVAVTTHPMMLKYLDQENSVGPGSRFANRADRERGLNENLAREVMELHTLGVGGAYSQDDVRQLAELFTGMGVDASGAFTFRPNRAEPGAETVLGHRYGGDPAGFAAIEQALRALAVHPSTASHIAHKLAVHFVSDSPDPALVDHVTARYRETDGDLRAVYAALLEHPAAWADGPGNVKPGFDFIASACRALALGPDRLHALQPKQINRFFLLPLTKMGQAWQKPIGPNGWPEEDRAWITPPGLSARIGWAMSVPRRLRPELPDPRDFVTTALGLGVPEAVQFAASAAETEADAVGLVLASPAFQRR
ncbi:DUF1800 domain-containing protein [Pseudodonghicola xiamenensis]|nr:DUF1800 domain-containing protein [Pseudodonghicola xiamenensis]